MPGSRVVYVARNELLMIRVTGKMKNSFLNRACVFFLFQMARIPEVSQTHQCAIFSAGAITRVHLCRDFRANPVAWLSQLGKTRGDLRQRTCSQGSNGIFGAADIFEEFIGGPNSVYGGSSDLQSCRD